MTDSPHPGRAPRARLALVALVAVAALAAGACGTQAIADAVRPPRSKAPAPVVDWSSRTVDGQLRAPWSIEFCEGEAPLLCVSRDGLLAGSLELLDYDLDAKSLDDWAADHLAWIAADRAEGCEEGYRVVPDPVAEVTTAGRDGRRVSVTGLNAAGEPVERSVLHAWHHQGRRFLVAAHGYAEDSCLGRSFSDFTVADVRALEPVLTDLIGAMKVEASYAIG